MSPASACCLSPWLSLWVGFTWVPIWCFLRAQLSTSHQCVKQHVQHFSLRERTDYMKNSHRICQEWKPFTSGLGFFLFVCGKQWNLLLLFEGVCSLGSIGEWDSCIYRRKSCFHRRSSWLKKSCLIFCLILRLLCPVFVAVSALVINTVTCKAQWSMTVVTKSKAACMDSPDQHFWLGVVVCCTDWPFQSV